MLVLLTALLVAACTSGDGNGSDGDTAATDEQAEEQETVFEFDGPDEGSVVNAEQLEELRFAVTASGGGERTADDLAIHLDDQDVTDDADVDDTSIVYEPGSLDDGEHTVAVVIPAEPTADGDEAGDADGTDDADSADGADGADSADADGAGDATDDDGADSEGDAPQPEPEVLHTWTFTIDTTAPELELTSPEGAVVADEPVLIAGTTEPGATVTVDGQDVETDDEGAFEVELESPPEGEFEVVAVDEAGNRSEPTASRLVTVPSRADIDEIRGVHVTSHAWAHPDFRERVLRMVDEGRINTIQLDLKDEGGRIGYDTEVELAIESGAAQDVYSLEEAVAELHDRGIHIVGRIVAFRDGALGPYARDNGHMDWLIQTPDGEPYTGSYGCCFTSFAQEDVIEYHLDLAEEAAAAGVDDILWDYIRRPDGSPENMVVPGVSDDDDGETLEEAVVEFARRADERLAPYGVGHGASLYGIAADRPTEIAQDVPALSEHLDYVAPMIYPSHWGPGEYGVSDPNRQPYDIITATLEVWKEATDGKRARIVPWLEDTNYRAWNRPEQVRQQIQAAADQGIDEWIMWDPVVDYTVEAYERRE